MGWNDGISAGRIRGSSAARHPGERRGAEPTEKAGFMVFTGMTRRDFCNAMDPIKFKFFGNPDDNELK
jgi:hypothetical protein